MIIHKPQVTKTEKEIIVSAKIESTNFLIEAPDTLWFKFPLSYQDYITDRADGFVVGLLPTAMKLGENIEVEGDMSPRLAHGIEEYQQVQKVWWPRQFKKIDIIYKSVKKDADTGKKGATGCSFSGGVDSFYTLWKHLPENETIPDYRITHCLLINGFDKDVDLENTGLFDRTKQVYEPMFHELGLNLLISCTNLQEFRLAAIESRDLHCSFGSAITASVLVLGNLLSRFYLPGSHTYEYDRLIPEGAHAVLDHLLSTENLEIIHDGAEASRVEKTTTISNWPATYSKLRVCFNKTKFNNQTGVIENCCRCEKCIRTMISLDLLKALSKYETFPITLQLKNICKTRFINKGFRLFCKENLRMAKKKKRHRMTLVLFYSIIQGLVLEKIIRPIYRKFIVEKP